MPEEGPLGWLEKTDAEEGLKSELRGLGLMGTLALLAGGTPDPEVAKEALDAARGLSGKKLARALHELYGLEGHGLIAADVSKALDFAARSRGDGDAREAARALARISRVAAKVVLGHLEEQIHLVHRLQTEDLTPGEIDKPLLEFAPRIFAARLPSMLKTLLPNEARVRLAVVLWGRLRGVSIGKEALVHALDSLAPEKPASLIARVAGLDRAPLLAVAGSKEAIAVEDASLPQSGTSA
jgi:hypothetical protein